MLGTCDKCGRTDIQVGEWPFCDGTGGHGFSLVGFGVVGDLIPGGMVIENMTAIPETFYSKSDWKRRMKELGLINKVEHVGRPGTDRSSETQRWV